MLQFHFKIKLPPQKIKKNKTTPVWETINFSSLQSYIVIYEV